MFMTRCRYYDDNGISINGGCHNDTCQFIHPSHPRWDTARKPAKPYGSPRGTRGRGRGRGESPAGTRGRSQALVGSASSRKNQPQAPAFDPSTWGSGSTMLPAETDTRWGSPSTGANGDTDKGGGWGTSVTASGESGVTLPTWGNDDGTTGSKNSVWGDSGGWGSAADNGWGAVTVTPVWGTVDDKEPRASPALDKKPQGSPAWGRPSPAVEAHPVAGPSGQSGGSRASVGWGSERGVDQDLRMSPPASETTRVDPSAASRSSKEVSVPYSPVRDVESTDGGKEVGLKIRTTSLERDFGPLSSALESAAPLRPLSQSEIYSRGIRKFYSAISLRLQLEGAQFRDEQWKRTTNHPSYAHGTPMQRIRLEEERAKLTQEVVNLTRDLKNATNALVDLPLLSISWNSLPPVIDEEEILKHTVTLRNWMSELQNFHMLAPPPPPPPPPPKPETPKSISEWDQLILNVEELEGFADQIEELMTNVYTSKYTNLMDEAITEKSQEYFKEVTGVEEQKFIEWESLKKSADGIGGKVGAEAIRLADLYTQVQNNDLELQGLQAEKEKLVNITHQMEDYFKELEKLEQEDLKKIQILTEKVQNLHLHPPSSALQSFPLDSLLPAIRDFVASQLQSDVPPIVDSLHGACIQNHELAMKELLKNVQPIVDVTTGVYKYAQLEVASLKHF